MNTSRKEKAEQTDAHAQVQRLGQKCCIRMVTSIAHAPADPFARNPTTSSCLIWSSHIPSFPKLVSILILPSVAFMSTLFCVFTFIDMAFPYPSDTQSDMCAKNKCKADFAETGFCKIKAPDVNLQRLLPPPPQVQCCVGERLPEERPSRHRPTQQSFRKVNIELWGEGAFILQNPVSANSALHLFFAHVSL